MTLKLAALRVPYANADAGFGFNGRDRTGLLGAFERASGRQPRYAKTGVGCSGDLRGDVEPGRGVDEQPRVFVVRPLQEIGDPALFTHDPVLKH